MNVGTLVSYIETDARGFTSGLHEAQTGLLQLDRSTQGVSRNVGRSFDSMVAAARRFNVGVVAAVGGAGLSIGYMVSRMTGIGMELENSLAIAGGIMRATAEEMAQMTEVAKAMGGATEFSSAQAAEALKFLGQAGFNVQQAIAALPGTLDLATAGQLDLARSADIASGALLAMQLPIDQLSRVNDVFIGTANRASTDIELMTESFKYAAPIAAAYGYTIEELSALIGVLGSRQIKGSMAGTQLAMSIQKAYQYAREMGLEGTKLLDVLDHLSKSGKDLKDIIPEVFDLRSSRAALTLAPLTDDVRDFTKELENAGGEAKTLANIMRNTTKTLKAELESAIESVAEDSFGKYRDELRDLIWATATWFRENKGEIVAVVETVTAGVRVLGSAVGGVVEILGGGLQGLTAFAQIEQEARDADGVLKSLEKSAAAVVDRATGKNRDDLAQIAEELVASAKELKALGGSEEDISRLEGTFSQLKTAAERLKITVTGLDGNFDTMARSIEDLSADARQLQEAAAPPEIEPWITLGNLIEGLAKSVYAAGKLIVKSITTLINLSINAIAEMIRTVVNDVAHLVKVVVGVSTVLGGIGEFDNSKIKAGIAEISAALKLLELPDFSLHT